MFEWRPRSGIAAARSVGHSPSGRICRGLCVLFVLIATATALAQYPIPLTYMSRGDWKEGLEPEPRSDNAIALLSAVADVTPRETYSKWPSSLRLRFYLPRDQSDASISVRQIHSLTGYYRLDNVTPKKNPWTAGNLNDFAWPADVVADVYEYQIKKGGNVTRDHWIADLGVIIDLQKGEAAATRQVAPAAVFHATQPGEVAAYQFTFKTNAAADITDAVLSAKNLPVYSDPRRSTSAGSPFTVVWRVGNQPEGWYTLVVDAAFKGGPPLQHNVRFYHKRSLAK